MSLYVAKKTSTPGQVPNSQCENPEVLTATGGKNKSRKATTPVYRRTKKPQQTSNIKKPPSDSEPTEQHPKQHKKEPKPAKHPTHKPKATTTKRAPERRPYRQP